MIIFYLCSLCKEKETVSKQDFGINIFSLKIGNHEFDYEIDGDFLKVFNPDLVEEAKIDVLLELRKSETMLEAHFSIKGTVELTCDRSLEVYSDEVEIQKRMFFKFGDQAEVLSDEIEIIPYNQHELDVSHLIYEFIAISIPMKKLHPKFEDEEQEGEFESLFYTSKDSSPQEEDSSTESDEDDDNKIDPRWEALKNISKN